MYPEHSSTVSFLSAHVLTVEILLSGMPIPISWSHNAIASMVRAMSIMFWSTMTYASLGAQWVRFMSSKPSSASVCSASSFFCLSTCSSIVVLPNFSAYFECASLLPQSSIRNMFSAYVSFVVSNARAIQWAAVLGVASNTVGLRAACCQT